jgi:hypothetical protein
MAEKSEMVESLHTAVMAQVRARACERLGLRACERLGLRRRDHSWLMNGISVVDGVQLARS